MPIEKPFVPFTPKRLLLETSERTLVIEEKMNGYFHVSEGLDGDYHSISITRTELLMAVEMILGENIM